MSDEKKFDEELIQRVEKAAHDGARQGVKESGGIGRKRGLGIGTLIKLALLIIIVVTISTAIASFNPFSAISHVFDREEAVEDHDVTLENHGVLGYTVADFAEAILGDSSQMKKLEVYTREVSDMATLTQAGFAKLKIFSKCQCITYNGTATYTVDLKDINEDSITLDEENKKVTLSIPHVTLENISIPEDSIEYGEVKKGKLAFGSIKATAEEIDNVRAEAETKMNEKLEEENVAEEADRFAKMSVWEIYQPLITGVSPEYTLEIDFQE